jgi:hypothetical protein
MLGQKVQCSLIDPTMQLDIHAATKVEVQEASEEATIDQVRQNT